MTPHNEPANPFPRVLTEVLALSRQDQQQVYAVLARVIGEAPADQPAHVEVAAVPEQPERASSDWLMLIDHEPPWSKVQLIDDALEREDEADQRQVLSNALSSLLSEHPQLAVRRAVTRVALEHPIGICAGGIGLLLGVVAIAQSLFRVLF